MKQVRAWLPQAALRDGKILKVLKTIVSEWAMDWFNVTPLVLSEVGRKDSNLGTDGQLEQGFATGPAGMVQIGGLMLGFDVEAMRDIAESDARFLSEIGMSAKLDLTYRLSQISKSLDDDLVDNVCSGNFRQYSVLHNNKELGLISLSSSQAIKIRKSQVEKAERASTELCSIDSLISDSEIKVGAFLGAVEVGLADLSSLECGQVVVMQQGYDAVLPLLINSKVSNQVGCTFSVTGDGAFLKVSTQEAKFRL
jgi:hypothetical protein